MIYKAYRFDDIPQQVADDIHAFGVMGTRKRIDKPTLLCYNKTKKGGVIVKSKKSLLLLSSAVLVVIIFAILNLIIRSFLFSVLLHTGARLISILIIVPILRRCFKDQLNYSAKKAFSWCAIVLTLDLVVIDAVSFILNGGISTVLFLPVCLPICFMIIVLFSAKDMGKESREKTIAFLVGIPLLLLSICFEIYSFVQI